jgi:CheY-like chemotaxis protein
MKYPILSGDASFQILIFSSVLIIAVLFLTASGTFYIKMRKKYFLENIRLNEKIRQIGDDRNILLSNLTREVKSGMIRVLGMNELIIRESHDDIIRDHAYHIKTSGEDVIALMQGTLDYTKLERGLIEVHREDIDLASLLIDVISISGPSLRNKGIILDLLLDKDTPSIIRGDYEKTRRSLINLFSFISKNSTKGYVKFSSIHKETGDGECEITFRIICESLVSDASNLENLLLNGLSDNKLLFSKKETGLLEFFIAGNVIKAIGGDFKVFETVDEELAFDLTVNTEIVDSTGIGDIKKVVRKKSFIDSVESVRFYSPSSRILYAEKDRSSISVIKTLLEPSGVSIDVASDCEEALTLIRINEYDVIFADLDMKDDKGIKLIKHIRSGEPNILDVRKPCIAIVDESDTITEEDIGRGGFTDSVSKPVNPATFEDMIIKYLPSDKIDINDESYFCPGIRSEHDIRKYSEGYDDLYKSALGIYKRARNYR